ncbi:DUF4012 domain-containing protein [Candidatus Parcubacteria bacterium]|nr:DUF4012 domain-containing protein [Patescibacteria group bacterium]MBU4380809.1 DUF4012 domain-containing protein [Patescibacteria group bacterium]MCG2689474.1 DUF4012 domain-containing protein [Candidatus Parcubacteria bacterium]
MTTKAIYKSYGGGFAIPKFSFPKPGRGVAIFFIVIAFLLVMSTIAGAVFVVLPGIELKKQSEILRTDARAIKDAFTEKDFTLVQQNLVKTSRDLDSFEDTYKRRLKVASQIPFVRPYYNDGLHAINSGKTTIGVVSDLLSTLEPFASQLGFKDGGSGEEVDNKTRIFNLLKLMPEISPQLSANLARVADIDSELSLIDENRYPEEIRGIKIREGISQVKSSVHEVSVKVPTLDKLFSILPDLLGLTTPKTYMLVMANNYELRMSGGFNTYLVLVKMDKGTPQVVMSIDTYDIDKDKSFLVYQAVPAHLRDYLLVTRFYARDATSNSPDFKIAVDEFLAKFWKVDYSMPQKFDGVIQVNNTVVENLLKVVGPVTAGGYSIKTDQSNYVTVPKQEFNSQNAIMELEKIAGGALAETIGRKDIIRYLMLSIIDKALNTPVENLGSLAQVFFNDLSQKNISLYFFDPVAQGTIEDLGYGGRLAPVPLGYDYLHVNNSNYGAGKRDWLITRELSKESFLEDGKKVSVVKMKTVNPMSPDWWQWMKFYRDYFRIYVPLGSKLISATASDGQDLKAKEIEDLGKTAIEGFFKLEENAENTITIKYSLPDTVDFDNYKLLLQKQSGAGDIPFTVTHKGASRSFDLLTDKELAF